MSTENPSYILEGCDFDAGTAQALNGKSIVAMVTDIEGSELLAIAGQQGLKYNMSSETTEAPTKDAANGGWSLKFHGSKSWDASIDGLYSPTDEATQKVAAALANDEYLCLKICQRIMNSDNSITYIPLRMGLAIVTSDSFDAPNDDNATYSMEFDGSGKPWLYETATPEQRTAASWTVAASSSSSASGSNGSTTATQAEITYTYEEVAEPTGNPSTSGYYELIGEVYVASSDTEVNAEKTYYTRSENDSEG